MFETIVVQPIFNALMLIYSAIPGGDFGVTLIIFTILIRFALYPLVKKQLHQTKMMRKLQPELAKIKVRTKGDKQAEAVQMMDLYKRYGVSPFRSIGILLIQLPIFIALYQVIQIVTLHRDQIAHFSYNFIETLGPIKQLIANPDSFNQKMLGFIDLTKTAISNQGLDVTLLVLALVSGLTQYIMTKQTMPTASGPRKRFRDIMSEAASGKQQDQSDMNNAVMQSMMKFMPVMMFFIMMSLPGAIALYYTISNLVAVAQQAHLLKQDVEELDEIADHPEKQHKKATQKAQVRAEKAKKATITRIVAKDTRSKKEKRS